MAAPTVRDRLSLHVLQLGAVAVVLARARTGRGARVDVSLFDALAEWMGAPAYYAARQLRCVEAR